MLLRSIAIGSYRCLRQVSVELDSFQLLVGANASGKSTFLDALAFVGRIVSDGLESAVEERTSDPRDLCWNRLEGKFGFYLLFELPSTLPTPPGAEGCGYFSYSLLLEVTNRSVGIKILGEAGRFVPTMLADISPRTSESDASVRRAFSRLEGVGDSFFPENSGSVERLPFNFGPHRSMLENLPEDETRFPVSLAIKRFLTTGLRKIVLSEKALRVPASKPARNSAVFDGSALPWLVDELIRTDQARFQRWLDHLRFALPDLDRIRVVERPEDRTRYLMLRYCSGLEIPSWLASEGTLRLLALTLPAYLPSFDGLYLVEEPENGIHPQAIESIYQSLSSVRSAQVMLATHSPVLVGLAQPKEVLCFARDDEGATTITRGDQHPRLLDWQGEKTLGSLFAAGVLS